MPISGDTLVKGYTFDGETGLKTGANLEDLVTCATPTNGSEMVDQATLDTYLDGALGVYRFRVADGGVDTTQLADGSVTLAKLAAGTLVPSAAEAYTCKAYMGSTQSVAKNTWTKALLDTEAFDDGNAFASNKFTVAVAGRYAVSGACKFQSIGVDYTCTARIYVNGSVLLEGTSYYTKVAGNLASQVSGILTLDVADYVELYVWHSHSAGNRTLMSGQSVSYMTLAMIATD